MIATIGALVCAAAIIENSTNMWNKQDEKHLEVATKRCGQLYAGSPCVKIFRKKEEGVYAVICGVPSEKNWLSTKR